MNKFIPVLFIAASVGAAFLFGYRPDFIWIPFAAHILDEAKNLAETLLIVTAFVERSTAILGSVWFDETIATLQVREMLARQKSKAQPDSQDAFSALEQATLDLAKQEAEKDRMRSFAALVIGLMVSAAGVRTLDHLLNTKDMDATKYAAQLGFFHSVDILITAGLIAGGTSGIKLIIDLLATIVNRTKSKFMRGSPEGAGADRAYR